MTKKEPTKTRKALLTAAFVEIHRNGYQAASVDKILAHTGVTKGALYHHFRGKQPLGLAVLGDLIAAAIEGLFLTPLADCEDPIETLTETIVKASEGLSDDEIMLGCPLNNLALEMSPVDEPFRQAICECYDRWRQGIADALRRGQAAGQVRAEVDVAASAAFVVGALAGCRSVAKNAQSRDMLMTCVRQLCSYLETLKT